MRRSSALRDPADRPSLSPAGLACGQRPAGRRRLGRLPHLRDRRAASVSGRRGGAPSSCAHSGTHPIGIASAVYALTWPKPWTLIPLNAALHATAAALLFRLLRGFVTDWRWAAVGVAPFVVFPSALVWVSQIHKDGFFIAGYLCLFVAWAELARHDPGTLRWRGLGRALVLLPVGFGLHLAGAAGPDPRGSRDRCPGARRPRRSGSPPGSGEIPAAGDGASGSWRSPSSRRWRACG